MSFILEALSKAEQNHAPSGAAMPPPCPPEKPAGNKKMLFLLIVTACLSSAAVSLLILYGIGKRPAPVAETRLPADTAGGDQHTPVPDAPPAAVTVSGPVGTAPEVRRRNAIARQEPGFDHLISHSSNKREAAKGHSKPKPAAAPATASPAARQEKKISTAPATTVAPRPMQKITDAQLTDMKIDVHMYSEIPAKRFVYINATRYGEKAQIGNGVTLYEITRDGIILDINGLLYRMPLKQ